MPNFSIDQMQQMQVALQERYKHIWEPICPAVGQNKLLWMIGEVGEVIDLVKKNGAEKVCKDDTARAALVEEMADVLMYYHDILLRFHVTPEEISEAYARKHSIDMSRDYHREYKEKYHG